MAAAIGTASLRTEPELPGGRRRPEMSRPCGNAALRSSTPDCGCGKLLQIGALTALLGGIDGELPVALGDQRVLRLAIAIEGPRQHRRPERQLVARTVGRIAGVPEMPGLAVAVHLALHQRLLGGGRNARRDQLARSRISALCGCQYWRSASGSVSNSFAEMMYSTPFRWACCRCRRTARTARSPR